MLQALARSLRSTAAGLALFALGTSAGAQGFAGPYMAAEHAAARGDIVAAADYYSRALARDGTNAELVGRAMAHQLAAGRHPQAVALAGTLSELSPDQHLAVLVMAADALRSGAPERAMVALPQANDDIPFVGRILGAWARFERGDAQAALDALAKLEGEGAAGPAGAMIAAYHMALIEAARGDDTAARTAIERAAGHAGANDPRLVQVRAGILARLGERDAAAEAVATVLDRGIGAPQLEDLARRLAAGDAPAPVVSDGPSGAAEALMGVARHLTRGTNWMVGIAYARLATYLAPDFVDAHMLIGDTLFAREQYELAIAAYEAVPDGTPEAIEARIGRANSMAGADRLGEAVAALRGLTARHPASIDAHSALGDVLRRNERFAEAATAYDGAIALIEEAERRHWPLYYQRGISHERSDQWPKAEADFLTALELEPDQPLVLNYLGYSWVDMGMHLDRAQKMIEKAVDQRPEDGYIVDSLGWVLYRLGDFEGAERQLGRAVELSPVDPVINDHYGDALWMVGRKVEAEFQWRRALSFDPDTETAERIRRKLEVGLDRVQAAEAEAGTPAVIGQNGAPAPAATAGNDGG